ncbi:MAG: hypothetical protein MUC65_03170 [Pontiellaceae bacterium]|nr:hypothetical protein [Pontiellaceae bacterium]
MKRYAISLGIMFCCFLSPVWCTAVQPYMPEITDPLLEPWRWRHEEMLDGLGVLCMDEAADGTLWFGGDGCVARYNGGDVTRIAFNDELLSAIREKEGSPQVKALLVLQDGTVLVLVDDSLAVLSGSEWRVMVKDIGASSFSARMEQGGDGTVWVIKNGSSAFPAGSYSCSKRAARQRCGMARVSRSFCYRPRRGADCFRKGRPDLVCRQFRAFRP